MLNVCNNERVRVDDDVLFFLFRELFEVHLWWELLSEVFDGLCVIDGLSLLLDEEAKNEL